MRNLPGWLLLGAFPDEEPNDVGSWILHANGEALLLEIPPGLTLRDVAEGLYSTGSRLLFVTASHLHEDHFDEDLWKELKAAYPKAEFIRPTKARVGADRLLHLGGEPLWLVKAPKHSWTDSVTVFRGTAMTGDIELGTLDSVNWGLSRLTKVTSMDYLKGFQARAGYHVHTIVSAHLNDFRQGVDWPSLFEVGR